MLKMQLCDVLGQCGDVTKVALESIWGVRWGLCAATKGIITSQCLIVCDMALLHPDTTGSLLPELERVRKSLPSLSHWHFKDLLLLLFNYVCVDVGGLSLGPKETGGIRSLWSWSWSCKWSWVTQCRCREPYCDWSSARAVRALSHKAHLPSPALQLTFQDNCYDLKISPLILFLGLDFTLQRTLCSMHREEASQVPGEAA